MCRALAGSEDAGNHPDLFPFPFSIPKSGTCSYSQFLFLSFQSLFFFVKNDGQEAAKLLLLKTIKKSKHAYT